MSPLALAAGVSLLSLVFDASIPSNGQPRLVDLVLEHLNPRTSK